MEEFNEKKDELFESLSEFFLKNASQQEPSLQNTKCLSETLMEMEKFSLLGLLKETLLKGKPELEQKFIDRSLELEEKIYSPLEKLKT